MNCSKSRLFTHSWLPFRSRRGEAVLSAVRISKALGTVGWWQGSTVLTVDISALEDELHSSRIGACEVRVAVEIELHKVGERHKANRDRA
eukprot:XP_001704889.1 Hypothetical protein GL50803_31871 [Giardia lamblia ATCC 50803]